METLHRYNDVEREVLKRIKPKKEEYEKGKRIYGLIRDRVERVLKEKGVEGEASLQGSFAKDTWLSGELDLDIFILFPEEYGVEWVKTEGFQLLVNAVKDLNYRIRYAEHPYVNLIVDNVEVDLVPALKIRDPSKIKTTVDRTPFHTEYVLRNLPQDKRDDVRLLKKFMKGIGVYGAEIKVEGFSGYLCELLVIEYGEFREVLQNASKWKIPQVVQVKGTPLDKKLLKTKFRNQKLIVPDPVDPKRNVAAAVSMKSLSTFIVASRLYIRKPDLTFFFPNIKINVDPLSIIASRNTGVCCIIFEIMGLNISPDILWGELKRTTRRLVSIASQWGFKVIDVGIWSDEERTALILIEVEQKKLPPYEVHVGPPATVKNANDFLEKYLYSKEVFGPWINNEGRLLVLRKRRYDNIISLIKDKIHEIVITPHLSKSNIHIIDLCELRDRIMKYKGLRSWIIEFALKKPVWMTSLISK